MFRKRKTGGFEFEEIPEKDPPCLSFKFGQIDWCSYLGMQPGVNEIFIKIVDYDTVLHQVMHALGFFHEHSRKDRDSYIDIDFTQALTERKADLSIFNLPGGSPSDYGQFTFSSIMYCFNIDIASGGPVLRDKAGNEFFGRSKGLSETDKERLRHYFN